MRGESRENDAEIQVQMPLDKAKMFYVYKYAASVEWHLVRLKVRLHYAARQSATHCSFATWQKLLGICRQCDRVHRKKEVFADLLQVTKTVEQDRRTWSDFFL